MIIALISALTSVGNVLIDKYALSVRKMKLSLYTPLIFLFLFLITFVTLPWLGGINVTLAAIRCTSFILS